MARKTLIVSTSPYRAFRASILRDGKVIWRSTGRLTLSTLTRLENVSFNEEVKVFTMLYKTGDVSLHYVSEMKGDRK